MTIGDITTLTLAGLGMALGTIGTVVPLLPGLPLIFLSVLLYGVVTQFSHISGTTVLVLGGITMLSFMIDTFAIAGGVRRMGGSARGALGALGGALVGTIFGGPLGLLIGMVVGVIIAEASRGTSFPAVAGASVGAVGGIIISSVMRFVLALVMIIVTLIDFFRS